MRINKTLAALAVLAAAGRSSAQTPITFQHEGPQPTQPGQTGTPEVQRGATAGNVRPRIEKRLGVISYCGDLSPNAGDFGIFGRQEWVEGKNPILSATPIGYFGAQNLVDMINYDDTIPRFREVHLIDGDREQPTAAQLANNFDCVIAYTDSKCMPATQAAIYNQAANALAGFAGVAGKGVVLSGMAFNTTTGFGDAIFAATLSPFRKASAALDVRCGPQQPCTIGSCPAGSTRQFPSTVSAPECFVCPTIDPADPTQTQACGNTGSLNGLPLCLNQVTGAECGQFARPVFDPVTATSDRVCESLVRGVNGPTSSSLVSALGANALRSGAGAVACLNYLNGTPLLAVNASRNVIGLNLFPAYSEDLKKTWFSCIVANAAILACGERRCIPGPGGAGTICD